MRDLFFRVRGFVRAWPKSVAERPLPVAVGFNPRKKRRDQYSRRVATVAALRRQIVIDLARRWFRADGLLGDRPSIVATRRTALVATTLPGLESPGYRRDAAPRQSGNQCRGRNAYFGNTHTGYSRSVF